MMVPHDAVLAEGDVLAVWARASAGLVIHRLERRFRVLRVVAYRDAVVALARGRSIQDIVCLAAAILHQTQFGPLPMQAVTAGGHAEKHRRGPVISAIVDAPLSS